MHQVSKILFCHETLHVSGICAHHQELSAVHMAIGMFHWNQPDSPRQRPHNLHETYQQYIATGRSVHHVVLGPFGQMWPT